MGIDFKSFVFGDIPIRLSDFSKPAEKRKEEKDVSEPRAQNSNRDEFVREDTAEVLFKRKFSSLL